MGACVGVSSCVSLSMCVSISVSVLLSMCQCQGVIVFQSNSVV